MSSCDVETLTMSHSILTFHMSALSSLLSLLALEGEERRERKLCPGKVRESHTLCLVSTSLGALSSSFSFIFLSRGRREERRAPGSLSTSREVRTLTTHRVSSSLPFFPFARAKGGRDYRRMDSWCTFLFLLAFEGEEKMKDAPGK